MVLVAALQILTMPILVVLELLDKVVMAALGLYLSITGQVVVVVQLLWVVQHLELAPVVMAVRVVFQQLQGILEITLAAQAAQVTHLPVVTGQVAAAVEALVVLAVER